MTKTLQDFNETAKDITGATVRFHMRKKNTLDNVVDAAATISDAANGVVQYAFQAADTDEAGDFLGEFEVTYAGGVIQRFPNPGHIQIKITQDLDSS